MKFDLQRMLLREVLHLGSGRVAVFGSPAQPPGRRVARRPKMSVERVETGVHVQPRTAPFHKIAKSGGAGRAACQVPLAKIAVQKLEDLEFDLGDSPIVDLRRGAQFAQSARELLIGDSRASCGA